MLIIRRNMGISNSRGTEGVLRPMRRDSNTEKPRPRANSLIYTAFFLAVSFFAFIPSVSADDPARQIQSALEAYQKNPSDKNSAKQLAKAYFSADKPTEVAKLMEKIADDNPSDAEARYFYGEALLRGGKYTEAAIELKRAFNLDSTKFPYAVRAGEALLAAQRFDDLAEWTKNALAKGPDPTSKTTLDWLLTASQARNVAPFKHAKAKGGA